MTNRTNPDPRFVRCHYCDEPIDATSPFTWRRVIGWERKGQASSRRSGSDVALREPLDHFIHDHCLRRLKAGVASGQETLV